MGCYRFGLYCRINNYELHWYGSSIIGMGKYDLFLLRTLLLNDYSYGCMPLAFICYKNSQTKKTKVSVKNHPLRTEVTKTRLIFIATLFIKKIIRINLT